MAPSDIHAPVCLTHVFGMNMKRLIDMIIAEKLPVRFQLQVDANNNETDFMNISHGTSCTTAYTIRW